MMDSKAVL